MKCKFKINASFTELYEIVKSEFTLESKEGDLLIMTLKDDNFNSWCKCEMNDEQNQEHILLKTAMSEFTYYIEPNLETIHDHDVDDSCIVEYEGGWRGLLEQNLLPSFLLNNEVLSEFKLINGSVSKYINDVSFMDSSSAKEFKLKYKIAQDMDNLISYNAILKIKNINIMNEFFVEIKKYQHKDTYFKYITIHDEIRIQFIKHCGLLVKRVEMNIPFPSVWEESKWNMRNMIIAAL